MQERAIRQTIEVLDIRDVLQNDPEHSAFAVNTYLRKNAFEVRSGFGQLAQFDSTLGAGPTGTTHGYDKILGSYVLKTNFDHIQILTVLQANVNTTSDASQWASILCLSIYDVTSNARWEETLHTHTSEQKDLQYARGTYQTNRNKSYSGFISTTEKKIAFVEYQDNVIFGNVDIGAWAYVPCIPCATNQQTTKNILEASYGDAHCESSRCFPLRPSPNPLYSVSQTYLDNASFPNPTAIAIIDNRIAYSTGRSVFFSDVGTPASIMSLNFIDIASEQDIVAMRQVNGSLFIWTGQETFVYQPNNGALINNGRLVKLSSTIGSLPHATCELDGGVVWASPSGIYAAEGLSIQRISDSISTLFDEGMVAPLGAYYQNSGNATSANEKATLVYQWDDDITITYEPVQKLLIVSVPQRHYSLVYQNKNWVVWSMETVTNTSATTVGTTTNIDNYQFLSTANRLFVVGGIDTFIPQSNSIDETESGSYYILEWGRGGGLDRSSATAEDNRAIAGSYVTQYSGTGYVLIDKPIASTQKLPQGTSFNGNIYPIKIVPRVDVTSPDRLSIVFMFDNTKHKPVCVGATAQIDAIIPPQRLHSRKGWGLETPVAGVAECQVYSSISGLADPDGDEIRCYFDGAHGAGIQSWSHAPYLNLNQYNVNPLIMLPFESLLPSMGLGIVPTVVSETHGGVTTATGIAWYNAPSFDRVPNEKAQAVDYVYRSTQLKNESGSQMRTRGMIINLLSRGIGDAEVAPTWLHGLLNVAFGSDFKDWVSQIVDYQGALQESTKLPLRARIKDMSGNMVTKVLNGSLKWGVDGDITKGNYLIDEEQVDNISVSDSVKGETLSFTVFGHIRNRANRVVISSMKALIDSAGSPRRRGR